MGELNFNRRQCLRGLQRLGFRLATYRGGRHDKLEPPPELPQTFSDGQPRFIMVPRHRQLHCQGDIVSELRKMGGDDLVEQFKREL